MSLKSRREKDEKAPLLSEKEKEQLQEAASVSVKDMVHAIEGGTITKRRNEDSSPDATAPDSKRLKK